MIPGGSNRVGMFKGKTVYQYNLNGDYIKSYPSAKAASLETSISHTLICRCCRKQLHRAG